MSGNSDNEGDGPRPDRESEAESAVRRAIALADERFLAGSGPGGQNVNKVATVVQLQVYVAALGLPRPVWLRLKSLAGHRLSASGMLTITARKHRTQDANRVDARERLEALLREAFTRPPVRKRYRLNRAGKKQRLKAKKARGQLKARRGKIDRSTLDG